MMPIANVHIGIQPFQQDLQFIKNNLGGLPQIEQESINAQVSNIERNEREISSNKNLNDDQKIESLKVLQKEMESIKNKIAQIARQKGETLSNSASNSAEHKESIEKEKNKGKNYLDSLTKDSYSAQEVANILNLRDKKQKTSKTWKTIRKSLGAALLLGGGIGTYLNGKKAEEKMENAAKDRKAEQEEEKKTMGSLNPEEEKEFNKEKIKGDIFAEKLRTNMLAKAAALIKRREQERRKIAEDVGLNLGNFAQIFNSRANRGTMQSMNELTPLLRLHSNDINNEL
jgi:hypothetical protein